MKISIVGGGPTGVLIRLFAIVGALAGLVLTPYVTTRPSRAIRRALGRLSAETLFAGLTGLIVGLLTAALLSFPLSQLPSHIPQRIRHVHRQRIGDHQPQ